MADEAAPARPGPSRRTFGLTVLAGLAGGGLTAVAGTRTWATASGDAAGIKVTASVGGADTAPLVAALALVALAAWGVVLVLRGRMRRVVAVLGLLASLGTLVAVVAGFGDVREDALAAVRAQGATDGLVAGDLGAAYYLTVLGAVVGTAAFCVAVRSAPGWPAMSTKYDAPGRRAETPVTDEDMWRAMDHGRDPTS